MEMCTFTITIYSEICIRQTCSFTKIPARMMCMIEIAYFLNAKFKDLWPFPTGVARGLLRPSLCLCTESTAACGIWNLPSGPLTGDTSTGSQSTGAYQRRINKINVLWPTSTNNQNKQFWKVSIYLSWQMATCAAANIFWTAAAISGPIPSPGMSVTVLTELEYFLENDNDLERIIKCKA